VKPGRSAFTWLAAFLVILMLTLLPVRSEPTSKVTWEDRRGLPLAFIQINRYTGPCAPEEEACRRISVAYIDPLALALDCLALGVVSGIITAVILKLAPSFS